MEIYTKNIPLIKNSIFLQKFEKPKKGKIATHIPNKKIALCLDIIQLYLFQIFGATAKTNSPLTLSLCSAKNVITSSGVPETKSSNIFVISLATTTILFGSKCYTRDTRDFSSL